MQSQRSGLFPWTAEEFREAFNKEQPRLQIESFKEETIDGEPWVSCVLDGWKRHQNQR